MRNRLLTLAGISSLLLGMLAGIPTAVAAAPQLVARMSVTTGTTSPFLVRPGEWDELNSGTQRIIARGNQLSVTVSGGTSDLELSLRITLGAGQRLQVGRTVPRLTGSSADLWYENRGSCALNWFDVRDLAYDGDDLVRLDLRFMTYCSGQVLGDLQLGPRAAGVAAGLRSLVWPETPIGTHHRLAAPIWIRNVGPSPVVVGQLQRSGVQTAEFPVLADRCSGRTLRTREGCLVEIGFAPRTPGVKNSVVTVAAGAQTVRVDLAGSAPTGRTAISLHSSPGNYLTNGYDRLLTDTFAEADALGWPDSVEVEFETGYSDWRLWLRTPDHTPLKLGKQRFGYAPVDPNLPELTLSGEGRACGAASGTFDLKQLVLGADGKVERLSISFRQVCIDDPAPLLVEISYRASDAPVAPSAPFALRTGQQLKGGGMLRNTDGAGSDQRLTLRSNGQAVITDRSGRTLWTSSYKGFGRSYRLGVLADGSVAITDRVGRPVWRQAPAGIRPGDFLLLQSDGNLVLYTPDYHPLWSALPT